MDKQFFINGVFFQNLRQLGIGFCSEVEGGTQAFISQGVKRFMYFGTIFPSEQGNKGLSGMMIDFIGESELSEIKFTSEESLWFLKKYLHRPDFIEYKFQFKDGLWVGGYSGEGVGEDVCLQRCRTDFYFHHRKAENFPLPKSRCRSH